MTQPCSGYNPLAVMWKTVSESCNLSCSYCYYSRCEGKAGEIKGVNSTLLERFIKEYMTRSTGVASFAWQGGEPLLAGLEFFERVVYLQSRYAPQHTTISNSLQTNGTLINEKWARFFKKYNFLIGVSLDGPKEINDKKRVTGSGKGSYQQIMRGIEHLRREKVDFNVLTVVHEGNVHQGKELMDFFQKENFDFVQFIPCMNFHSQETDKPAEFAITHQEYGNFLCDVFDEWYDNGDPKISVRIFENMLRAYLHQPAEACTHLQYCPRNLTLEQNGDAFPCDFYIHEDYRLGNVGVDSLADILASSTYQSFLELKPTLPNSCRNCEFIQLCHGGCPRNRFYKDGSAQVNYFCHSFKQVYAYTHDRVAKLANIVKVRWLNEYINGCHKLPQRNDLCLCGSGKKFKKCCQPLLLSNKEII